jgi:hypothetical protein
MASAMVAPKTSTVKLTLRSRTDDARQRAALEICKINIPDPKPVNVSVCNIMLVDAKREIHVANLVNDVVFAWKEDKCAYDAAVSPMHNGKAMTLTLPAGCMLQFVQGKCEISSHCNCYSPDPKACTKNNFLTPHLSFLPCPCHYVVGSL